MASTPGEIADRVQTMELVDAAEKRRKKRRREAARRLLRIVTGDENYIPGRVLGPLVVEGGMRVRDALILQARSRNMSYRKIAEMAGCSEHTVGRVCRENHEAIEAQQMLAVGRLFSSGKIDEVLDAQVEIATNTENSNSPRAARNVLDVAFPRKGKGDVNVAIGSNINQGSISMEEHKTVTFSEMSDLSDEELAKKLEEARAAFERPKPKVRDIDGVVR